MKLKELQSIHNNLSKEEESLQFDIRSKEKEHFKLVEAKKMLQYKIEEAKRKILSIDKELGKIDNYIDEAQNSLAQVRDKLNKNRREVREITLNVSANKNNFPLEQSTIMAGMNASVANIDSIFEDFSISVEPSQAMKDSLFVEDSNVPQENTFEKAVSDSRKDKEFLVGTKLGYVYSFRTVNGKVSVEEIMQLGESKQFIGKFKEYYVFFEIFNKTIGNSKCCVVYFYDSFPRLIGKTGQIDYSKDGGVLYSYNATFFVSPQGILMSAVNGQFLLIFPTNEKIEVKEYDWNHSCIIRDVAFTDENTMFCITKPDRYVFKVENCKTVASRQMKGSTWSLCVDHPTTILVGTSKKITLLDKKDLRKIRSIKVGYPTSLLQKLGNMLLVGINSGTVWALEGTKWKDVCRNGKGGKVLDSETFLIYGNDKVQVYEKYSLKPLQDFTFKGRIERFLEL